VFQHKLYPARAPSVPGLDVAGAAVPVSQVCGDYFDYIRRGAGRLAVSVGDVSGHGFGPALQMVEVRAALRVLLREGSRLGQAVAELNRMLCDDLPEDAFVSLLLLEVDAGKRAFEYVGAGHQALLFRADGGVAKLADTGPILGLDAAAFGESPPMALGAGDLVLLFTDGLTEATDPAGQPFGFRRLIESAARHRHEPSQAIVQHLFAAVHDFARGQAIQDDMTVVAVKAGGEGVPKLPVQAGIESEVDQHGRAGRPEAVTERGRGADDLP
jgi:sigma-B regulation protein RsbU (phosphoserine phosphatase)